MPASPLQRPLLWPRAPRCASAARGAAQPAPAAALRLTARACARRGGPPWTPIVAARGARGREAVTLCFQDGVGWRCCTCRGAAHEGPAAAPAMIVALMSRAGTRSCSSAGRAAPAAATRRPRATLTLCGSARRGGARGCRRCVIFRLTRLLRAVPDARRARRAAAAARSPPRPGSEGARRLSACDLAAVAPPRSRSATCRDRAHADYRLGRRALSAAVTPVRALDARTRRAGGSPARRVPPDARRDGGGGGAGSRAARCAVATLNTAYQAHVDTPRYYNDVRGEGAQKARRFARAGGVAFALAAAACGAVSRRRGARLRAQAAGSGSRRGRRRSRSRATRPRISRRRARDSRLRSA